MVGPRPRRGGGSERSQSTDSRNPLERERDETRSRYAIGRHLAAFVPAALARRAIAVSIETDREVYARDQPVGITVEFSNRLPVPVSVPTPRRRPWGWTIDGALEASDERRYVRDRPSAFRFGAGERKRVRFTWHGRLERTAGDRRESVVPDPGTYELRAFVATPTDRYRPEAATTIRFE